MKVILKSFLTIILFAFGYTFVIHACAPIYETPIVVEFSGDHVWNPYQDVDFSTTIKANFHAHTVFDTREEYTRSEFESVYSDAGYDYIGVANHNFITADLPHRKNYIPTYEHGWNANNYHILVLDAKTNDIVDAPFLFTAQNQMQWTINRLRDDAQLLSLNHPERLRFANKDNYKNLRGYDLMEANYNNDRAVWDQVLMQGNYIPLLSSDDAHSITNLAGPLQRAYTVVFSQDNDDDIIESIKNATSYGVIGRGQRLGEKHPKFKTISVSSDTLWVKLDQAPRSINFISNAQIIKSISDTSVAVLPISDIQNYVRIEVIYDSVTLVSNPLVWSNVARPIALPVPNVDILWTILNSVLWGILTFAVLYAMFKLWRKRTVKHGKSKNIEYNVWGVGLKEYDPS